MILVPVKNLADAKQRLSSILSPEERFALAQAMCEDVLQALASWQSRPAVTVVTSDSFARPEMGAPWSSISDDHVITEPSGSACCGRTNIPSSERSSASARREPERCVLSEIGHSTGYRRVARGGGGLMVTCALRAAVSNAVS